jgi:hypothetical protein
MRENWLQPKRPPLLAPYMSPPADEEEGQGSQEKSIRFFIKMLAVFLL